MHGLQSGDVVLFKEVKGMDALNQSKQEVKGNNDQYGEALSHALLNFIISYLIDLKHCRQMQRVSRVVFLPT